MVKLYNNQKKHGLEIIRFNSNPNMLLKIHKYRVFNGIMYGTVIKNMSKQVAEQLW